MRDWYTNTFLRRIALPVFARLNPGDITIRHHYTGAPLRLHSFRHKGYWFHGKAREADTMKLFARLIRPGDIVFEAGGHIGYVTTYFASLVEQTGRVVVFEPGVNNLPYLRANVGRYSQVQVVDCAVSDVCGKAEFYLE